MHQPRPSWHRSQAGTCRAVPCHDSRRVARQGQILADKGMATSQGPPCMVQRGLRPHCISFRPQHAASASIPGVMTAPKEQHSGETGGRPLPLLSFSIFFFFPRALQNKVHTLPLQTHHHLSVRLSAASPPEPQSRRSLAAAAREQMVPGEGRAPASRGLAAGGSRHSSASLTPILPSTVITRRAEQTACAGSLCRTPTKGG